MLLDIQAFLAEGYVLASFSPGSSSVVLKKRVPNLFFVLGRFANFF